MNKKQILSIVLIITSLIGYLEWGTDQSSFLFQSEGEILIKLFTDPMSAVHPFTLIPLAGQILLLISVFQSTPSKKLVISGIICIGILYAMILLTSILALNLKVFASTVPFIALSVWTIKTYKVKTANE